MSRIFDVQSEKWLKSNTGETYQAVKNHVECYSFLCILEIAETI